MMPLTILLALAMVAVLVMALREVSQFRRKREVYALRRLTLRISMALMLLFLFGSIIVGTQLFGLREPDGVPQLWMTFWGCVALLTGAILLLAIADVRTIGDETRLESNPYLEEMARIIAVHQPSSKEDSSHVDHP